MKPSAALPRNQDDIGDDAEMDVADEDGDEEEQPVGAEQEDEPTTRTLGSVQACGPSNKAW